VTRPRKKVAVDTAKYPLYPKWGGAKKAEDDCPRCGQSYFDTLVFSRGSCILCAIDLGEVDMPADLKLRGWRLHRSGGRCISAEQRQTRLSLPLYSSSQVEACIAQARGYQDAWDWLHDGGAGYAWGWRLDTQFHIKYMAVHPTLGRVPRGRHDSIWLDQLPEQIIVELVVEALQLAHHRRPIAAVVSNYAARKALVERANASARAFAAIPADEFEQKGFV
jgi:hypothetical protein